MSPNTSATFHWNVVPLTPVAAVLVLAAACAPPPSAESARGRVQPVYDSATGRLSKLAYDSNNDGKEDAWAYMDGARLVRLEADENGDGRIDRWEYYPPASAGSSIKQHPERIDRASGADGRVSRREYFAGAALARIEEDVDGNGAMDKWEVYVAGALASLTLDTSGDGKPDRRFIYRPDGSLDRVEADATGTGRFQVVKQ